MGPEVPLKRLQGKISELLSRILHDRNHGESAADKNMKGITVSLREVGRVGFNQTKSFSSAASCVSSFQKIRRSNPLDSLHSPPHMAETVYTKLNKKIYLSIHRAKQKDLTFFEEAL